MTALSNYYSVKPKSVCAYSYKNVTVNASTNPPLPIPFYKEPKSDIDNIVTETKIHCKKKTTHTKILPHNTLSTKQNSIALDSHTRNKPDAFVNDTDE